MYPAYVYVPCTCDMYMYSPCEVCTLHISPAKLTVTVGRLFGVNQQQHEHEHEHAAPL